MFVVEEKSNNRNSVYWNGKLVSDKVYLNEDGTIAANDDDIFLSIEELGQIEVGFWPEKWGFFMLKEIPGTKFYLTRIDRIDGSMVFEITGDSHSFKDSKWGSKFYFRKFSEIKTDFKVQSMEIDDLYDNSLVFTFNNVAEQKVKLSNLFDMLFEKLKQTIQMIELELSGFKWKGEYETNELLFCNEVLTPLFRKMQLNDLEFIHGISENGKDYVFSETKKFGTAHYSAIQVKAGSLDGKVNGKLKEILEQIDDAFKVPFEQMNHHEKKYIDTFYVVSSGKITEAARLKIRSKIKSELIG